MRKVRELEERIARIENENAELKAKVDQYAAKESAIASALTEAQSTASRLVREAEEKAAAMLAKTQQRSDDLDAQTDAIREQAAEQATKIVEDAQQEAGRRLAEADMQTQSVRDAAQSFSEQLAKAALDARGWSDRFSQYLKEASGGIRETFSLPQEQGKGLDALIQDPPVELPEDYRTPAELIQNIYKLQGRDIPETAKPAEAKEEEERVWTVDEVVGDGGEAESPRDAFSAELDAIIDDVLN